MTKLGSAEQEFLSAANAYHNAFFEAFPIGAYIYWETRGYLQTGIVVDHNRPCSATHEPRLRVRNDRTRKVVWVDHYAMKKASHRDTP